MNLLIVALKEAQKVKFDIELIAIPFIGMKVFYKVDLLVHGRKLIFMN